MVFHESQRQCTQLRATSLRFASWISTASHLQRAGSLPPATYSYITGGSYYKHSRRPPENRSSPCRPLDGEVSRCRVVLAREGWSCCWYRRPEVEGVVEHARWAILTNTKATIVCAHRLVLTNDKEKENKLSQCYF
jgi:hypothetical protein